MAASRHGDMGAEVRDLSRDKVRDVQGKQRSRVGLSKVATRIPGSPCGLDTDSVGDPGQAIPTLGLPSLSKEGIRSDTCVDLAGSLPCPLQAPSLGSAWD